MLLVVYNFKGGEGKSRIAQNLALTMDYSIITNDVFSPIEKILKNHQFLKIWPDQKFPDVSVDDDIIFDLGGYPDGRVVQILKKSRFIIVPITNEIDNIQVGINTIDTIEKYNKNIIIIANRTTANDFQVISNDLSCLYNYPIFEVKKSTALSKLSTRRQSIREIVKNNPLLKYNYNKINDQFNSIISYLTNMQ